MRRIKKLGFRARSASAGGRKVLKRRRAKGRKELSVTKEYKLLRKNHRKDIR